MNTENVKAWTTALRTTESQQATAQLGYTKPGEPVALCCLGVGIVECGLPHEWNQSELVALDEHETFSRLPGNRFLEWLGASVDDDANTTEGYEVRIDWPQGLADHKGGEYSQARTGTNGCSALNDILGLTFEQIADVVDYFGVI